MYARTSRFAYKSTLLVGGQKMSKIGDQHISRPLVYHLVSDVADAINSTPRDAAVRKVHVFCDELNS